MVDQVESEPFSTAEFPSTTPIRVQTGPISPYPVIRPEYLNECIGHEALGDDPWEDRGTEARFAIRSRVQSVSRPESGLGGIIEAPEKSPSLARLKHVAQQVVLPFIWCRA